MIRLRQGFGATEVGAAMSEPMQMMQNDPGCGP